MGKDSEKLLENKVNEIKENIGTKLDISSRKIIIKDKKAAIIYIDGLVNKDIIDRDILSPLMFKINEDLEGIKNLEEYICKKFIPSSEVTTEDDMETIIMKIKSGYTAIVIEDCLKVILIDTIGGNYRDISDPINESSIKGSREGFADNLKINLSIITRRIKDKNLVIENLVMGKVSKTDVAVIYIDGLVNKKLVSEVKNKLKNVETDNIMTTGIISKFIENHKFTLFPQSFSTERPDLVQANLIHGKIAIMINGSPFAITVPTIFPQFFYSIEDYTERTFLGVFTRGIRYIATFIVITLPAIYLTFVKFNAELIPLEFIESLIESREGIALTPFMSLISMNLIVEFLREGGLRLPNKIGQTLSVVGGIIIGDAAIKSKLVSSATLVVVGVTTVGTFLIPSYEMELSIRIVSMGMAILGNFLGMLGVAAGWFMLIGYLVSLDSYGVPYLSSNPKDNLIRKNISIDKNQNINKNTNKSINESQDVNKKKYFKGLDIIKKLVRRNKSGK